MTHLVKLQAHGDLAGDTVLALPPPPVDTP